MIEAESNKSLFSETLQTFDMKEATAFANVLWAPLVRF